MPVLRPEECYRLVGPVDVAAAVAAIDRLQFVLVGQSSAAKYKCFVAFADLPQEFHDLIASLDLGGTTHRAVVRRLEPRQSIPVHVDDWMPAEADWRRFQVPLVTDPSVVMRWPDDGIETHLAVGNAYEVRYDRAHEVVNNWDGRRVHLQIEQIGATV